MARVKHAPLVRCVCGGLNLPSQTTCYKCGRSLESDADKAAKELLK